MLTLLLHGHPARCCCCLQPPPADDDDDVHDDGSQAQVGHSVRCGAELTTAYTLLEPFETSPKVVFSEARSAAH